MSVERIGNHPQRLALTNELHARPFQPMQAPGRCLHLALKPPANAAERDLAADRDHLIALLDRHGAAHPAPDASHHTTELGRVRLKWEQHTEFVSYTLYEDAPADTLFAPTLMQHLPDDWLAEAPGKVIAAIELELLQATDADAAMGLLRQRLAREFHSESSAAGWVLEGNALVMGDFRIHEGGFSRFVFVLCGDAGSRRIGRVCHRLLEIEVYRSLAMLALPIARRTAARLNEIERELGELIAEVASDERKAQESAILASLTQLSAEIEKLAAESAFRFGAGRAYDAIVRERIEMLDEERVAGRQQFREFMLRRFDPAMRTVQAAERRLGELAVRASRVAELLRTRVNVAVEAQNQRLLASMDARAGMQLRLQQTVEGLSVVAISYYAVGLAVYLLAPLAGAAGVEKEILTALVAIPVIGGVWWFVRRIRRRIDRDR
jgi:uncharacterized membrane-anchored protein